MAGHLHWHAIFDVAFSALQRQQRRKFVPGIKALDRVGRLVVEERLQAVDNSTVVLRAFDRIPLELIAAASRKLTLTERRFAEVVFSATALLAFGTDSNLLRSS